MIRSLLNSTSIPLLERVAAFTERRQEVIAGNIANIDTPDYKMRDLPVADFQAALSQAIHRIRYLQADPQRQRLDLPTHSPVANAFPSMNSTGQASSGQLAPKDILVNGLAAGERGQQLLATNPLQELNQRELYQSQIADSQNVLFHDSNNRSIEHQVMEMTKNSMMQRMAIELMMAQTRTLETVISERV